MLTDHYMLSGVNDMKLKKCSAVLSLLTFLMLLLHMGYSAYAYLTFFYNPALTKAFSVPLIVLTCLHGAAGMCAVFLQSDGTRADLYPKKNVRTIIQRITAALIFPLLILHINTFGLLQTTSSEGQYLLFALLIAAQVLFYIVLTAHAAVSFGKALITLGALRSAKAHKAIDAVIGCLCGALLAVTAFAVIKGQLAMFLQS